MCARACARACACNERVRLCVCSFLCLLSFVCVCVHARCVRAACVGPCTRAFVSTCACVCAFPSDCIFARIARRALAVLIAPRAPRVAAAHAWLHLVRSAGLARFGPQVSRGRAARRRRRGLPDLGTRPWSTPPAPSTSSAATAATKTTAPTSRACGRAPTEVRGPDSVGVVGGYWVGTQGGTPWVPSRVNRGVLKGQSTGTTGVLVGY